MSNVTIQKRGKYYQYKFEIAKVDGKRKFINKSGVDTKDKTIRAGNIAYTEYLNTGLVFKEKEISFSDYLGYWYENYCEMNLKYNTRRTYKTKQGTRQINMSITLYNALMNYKKKLQYLKKIFGSEYYTYHFEDVLNKYGKVTEKRIVQNEGNILQINKADIVFTRKM